MLVKSVNVRNGGEMVHGDLTYRSEESSVRRLRRLHESDQEISLPGTFVAPVVHFFSSRFLPRISMLSSFVKIFRALENVSPHYRCQLLPAG